MKAKDLTEPFSPAELFQLGDALSVEKAAELMNLSQATVRDRIKDGSLIHVRVRGRIMVPKTVVQAFIAAHTMAPMKDDPKNLAGEALWMWRQNHLLRTELARRIAA